LTVFHYCSTTIPEGEKKRVLIQLPGIGRSIDSIILEVCQSLGIERWGGASGDGWSKQSDFLRCPYRYYLKHVRGVGPLEMRNSTDALDVGSCLHLLLATHYARLLPDERYPGFQPNPPSIPEMLEAFKVARLPMQLYVEAERLIDGYLEYWGAESISPVAIEMPVGRPGLHTSRYDMVAFVNEGLHEGLWIFEHKTASPKTDLDDFRLDGEVLGELFSWELSAVQDQFGAPVLGVCINALVKSDIPRYQRLWLTFPQTMVNEFANDQARFALWAKDCETRNYWPRSLYGCKAYFRRCRFWEHCRTRDDKQLVQLEKR
jgi:hypothetical protein